MHIHSTVLFIYTCKSFVVGYIWVLNTRKESFPIKTVSRYGGGGPQQIQLRTEDKENGDMGAVAPLVRGSEGSCNLVQEISFHMVKFS